MAGRIRNRLDLRRQAEAAELRGPAPADAARPRRATGGGTRVCARWGVFDSAMKLVETFAYNQRAQADAKVAELNAKRTGTYFVQMVKQEMADGRDDD